MLMNTYLRLLPDLRIALDISHWCNIAEYSLNNQSNAVDRVISGTDQIHARVGFSEGAQIPDLRVPAWPETLNIYLNWRKKVLNQSKQKGNTEVTNIATLDPFPYMSMLPFTLIITTQWEVNVCMKDYSTKHLTD